MSGGHFQYAQYRIHEIKDEIEHVIYEINQNKKAEWSDDTLKWDFKNPQTVKEFKKAIYYLTIAYEYAQRIDWLLSCDDGEETFHERLHEDLSKVENSIED